jgi:hypothetical protein
MKHLAVAGAYQLPAWADHTVVICCWGAAVLFAVLYSLKAPWWRSWMGRNLFAFDIAVAGALTPGLLKYLFDVDPASAVYAWFLVADLSAVTLLILHRGFLLWRVQSGWNWRLDEERANGHAAGADDGAGRQRRRAP